MTIEYIIECSAHKNLLPIKKLQNILTWLTYLNERNFINWKKVELIEKICATQW